MMTAAQIIFYILSAFVLGMGLLAVTTRKIFRSAVWLLFCLISVAGIYFWMEMEFIAAVQIIVYVGGIVVLIIFSIFLTQQSGKEMPAPPLMRKIAAITAVLLGFALTCMLIYNENFPGQTVAYNQQVSDIGTALLNSGKDGFALPFEVVSILLLAAMIGCIVIAMRAKPKEKEQ
jgi:NADH-quinone oxidoreductase subunit J